MVIRGAKLQKLHTAGETLKRHLELADTNRDGRLTSPELRTYGQSLNDNFTVGRALVTVHSWALRENERGSSASVQHTKAKVDDALAILDGRDSNHNGVLDEGRELNSVKRLKTYQVLAAMSGQGDVTKLDARKLGTEVMKHAEKAVFMSEGDYTPEFFAVRFGKTKAVTGESAFRAMRGELVDFFEVRNGNEPQPLAFEASSRAETSAFLKGIGEAGEGAEDYEIESAQAFAKIVKLLKANLTDIVHLKVGPKDQESGGLAVDQGLYAQVLVGKAKDGKLAGILIGDVET